MAENLAEKGTKIHEAIDSLKYYLGDGVYAVFDGYNVWLHANDLNNPSDSICLEPTVLKGLFRFSDRCQATMKSLQT